MSQFFTSGDRSIGASASATILPMNFRVEKTLKSPPAPQFESINSLALSLLYDPTFPSVHDYSRLPGDKNVRGEGRK